MAFLGSSGSGVAAGEQPAQPVETAVLHNVFRVDAKLYSGNGPEDEAAFRELSKLGVKTIISVDGSQPKIALARKFGMRYVHLPIGYDGVPQSRANELTKAAQMAEAAGPVYLHCHHGKHRGPSAVAVVCRALDGWSVEKADAFLKQAGTAPDYAGLYRDVRAFRPPTAEELARLPAQFPESVKAEPLVDAMVAIDEHFDALKAAQKAAWREIPGHPDLTPAQASTLIWERLRELARDPDTKKRGADYEKMLTESEQSADALRQLLRDPASEAAARDAAFSRAGKSCATCHKAHRN
jgi:protein tyrosine phosphatase (PTP) superfamily phosphohydrolase (DUF442 family)/cytochrome c556